MAKFLTRVLANGEKAGALRKVEDTRLMKECPALFEYLTVESWEEGVVRETATLLVFVEEGTYKCCLSDRANARKLWAQAPSFQGLLAALEARLTDPVAEWRVDRRVPSTGKPRNPGK